MIPSIAASRKRVMVSGHFDPVHYGHLLYLKEAASLGRLICVVSSDEQVKMKKGKVNENEGERLIMLHTLLNGAGIEHEVFINRWDTTTPSVTKAIKALKPDIFCRGADKKPSDFPENEKAVCKDLGIPVRHIKTEKTMHGSEFI